MFRPWQPEPEYHKDTHSIASEFYLRCMREAVRYDRITGYFSSGVYILAWSAMAGFIERGGTIRIICSPVLSDSDLASLDKGYSARSDDELASALIAELDALLQREELSRPATALAGLIVAGVVEVKIATLSDNAPASTRRHVHDKVGIFVDAAGDSVGFRGSMNETFLGLADDGNLESIDAFPSWVEGRDEMRVKKAAERFSSLWDDDVPGVLVRPFPSVAMSEFEKRTAEVDIRQLLDGGLEESPRRPIHSGGTLRLRENQEAALIEWEATNRKGLLAHATGAGKTITAIIAIQRELEASHTPVVVVPSRLLLHQWDATLRLFLQSRGVRIHTCGDTSTDWKRLLRGWLEDRRTPRVIVAVANTAASAPFLRRLEQTSERLFFVADEVHRLGAPSLSALLRLNTPTCLGLSATPERAGDPAGTQRIFDCFGSIVHTFTIHDAIKADILTKYRYEPHFVQLTDSEQSAWESLTTRLSRLLASLGDDAGSGFEHPAVRQLLLRRARIVKKAEQKVGLGASVLSEHFTRSQRWLVYCEDTEQLETLSHTLLPLGLPVMVYHSTMVGDRGATMARFNAEGGIILSIRCLDEGVDIPAASHALILASSRNPREFVQRRGRVLRYSCEKSYAVVHDALVIPSGDFTGGADRLVLGEYARAYEFANWALNPTAKSFLERQYMDLGGDLRELSDFAPGGFESDDGD